MLKEELKPSTLNIILITFKGTDRRFDVHTLALLKFYEEIFGKEMWRNVVVEMSYWGHKNKDACDRKNNYDPSLDEEVQRQDLQMKVILNLYMLISISLCQLREVFGLTFEVPLIFVDPVLKVRFMIKIMFSLLIRFSIHLNTIYGELWSPEKKTSSSTRHRPCGSLLTKCPHTSAHPTAKPLQGSTSESLG